MARFSKYHRFVREMSLVYIMSVFESYLEKILRITLLTDPRIISGRSITMKRIIGLGNVEEIKNAIIDKEISDLRLQDPEKIDAKFSESSFKLELSRLPEWKDFSERFYRRHVIVHNEAIPDSKYREKVGYTGPEKRLNTDGAYLSESIRVILSVGYSNMTPWNCPGDISEEELISKLEKTTCELTHPETSLFNFHCPPYDTQIDVAPKLDKDLRPVLTPGGEPEMSHVGSTSVRKMIEKFQPLAGLHGHIHEARGFSQIGKTVCFNPGSEYTTGVLRGLIVNLSDKKIDNYVFTEG
jgi:hypothetical protein